MKPLLVVKTGTTLPEVRAARGDFEAWIERGLALERARVEVVAVFEGDALPAPRDVTGIVVTGSSAMVSEREPWSERAAAWLARAVAARVPVLGICYGHQLLAHALGGRVGPNPHGREIGTVDVDLLPDAAGDALLGDAPARERFHATHVEAVLALPRAARRLARTALDPHHAFRIDDARGAVAWGVQFHPEFDEHVMRGYLEARREALEAEGLDARAALERVAPTPAGPQLLARFGRIAEGSDSR
ncbi:MAG: glutamine amidotransferase [Myxococcota bacterium]